MVSTCKEQVNIENKTVLHKQWKDKKNNYPINQRVHTSSVFKYCPKGTHFTRIFNSPAIGIYCCG